MNNYWASENFAARMTGFNEAEEMTRGRRDALAGVERDGNESAPYLLSFDHWRKLKRRKATRYSMPLEWRKSNDA